MMSHLLSNVNKNIAFINNIFLFFNKSFRVGPNGASIGEELLLFLNPYSLTLILRSIFAIRI